MKRTVLLLTLSLCALTAPVAMAESNLGLRSLGVAAGLVSPDNLDGTFSIGGFADWGTIAPRIGLESRLDYWSGSQTSFDFKTSIRDITLGARAKYFFESRNPRLRPFAGAGLGLHFLKAEVDIPVPIGFPAMTATESDTKLGLDLGGGIATSISPRTDFLGEVWYGIVSDVSQFSLRVGLSHRLGS
jgi:opacity protein-like surface antigen